eukprot:2671454-Pleurochrysis_carterae.AAC.1
MRSRNGVASVERTTRRQLPRCRYFKPAPATTDSARPAQLPCKEGERLRVDGIEGVEGVLATREGNHLLLHPRSIFSPAHNGAELRTRKRQNSKATTCRRRKSVSARIFSADEDLRDERYAS